MTTIMKENLPNGQDQTPDVTGWQGGPLPDSLEQIALLLFQRQYPTTAYGDPSFSRERNDARRFALRLRIKFLKLDRWTLDTMLHKLEDGFTRIVCGDRGPSTAEQALLHTYAEECLLGLMARFSGDRNPIVPADDSHTWSIPSGHGISDKWRQAYVSTRFAEVLTALTVPGVEFRKLDVEDRAWLRGQTEQLVEDTVSRFTEHPGDDEYKPEEEADYDFDGNPEREQ